RMNRNDPPHKAASANNLVIAASVRAECGTTCGAPTRFLRSADDREAALFRAALAEPSAGDRDRRAAQGLGHLERRLGERGGDLFGERDERLRREALGHVEHDGLAGVAAFDDAGLERDLAEERDAHTLGRVLGAAVREDLVAL